MYLMLKFGFLVLALFFLDGKCKSQEMGEMDKSASLDMREYDVPEGASIVASFVNNVHSPHMKSICSAIAKGRQCMNVTQTVPIMLGR